jgi:[protein-PII] uridylyltransferase
MGLPPQEVAVVQTLVREHLTLIDLATRRDPTDPQTLVSVMAAVDGSRELLELLRALTEADASAAGPAAWTDWRAQLLARLVDGARGTMVEDHQPEAPPRDSPEVVTSDIIAGVVAGEPHVVVRTLSGAHRVDVFDRDRLGLFADTAGLLAASGLVVRTAILRTYEGVAADQWQVESPGGDAPDATALARGLRRLADGDRSPLQSLERRRAPSRTANAPPASGSPGQTRAMVVPHASDDATVIEVRAVDRVGLLHEIGMTFARAGLSVRSAHIATYAGQTLDTFYVTEFGGRSLPPARVAQAVSMLIDACDGVLSRGR